MTDSIPFPRTIRSFVLRAGRITSAQQQALDTLWPRYGIDPKDAALDFDALFGRKAPVILEIGFGNGESLATMAEQNSSHDFLGVEVHRPGVGHLLQLIHARQLKNVRLICRDAVEVLVENISDVSLAGINLFFPDPWPKKRHHKRRIVQPDFIELMARKLKPGGLFHFATDWQDYMEHVMTVMTGSKSFTKVVTDEALPRPATKFQRRGQKLGHGVWDLVYRKIL
ncbi:MAG TPA: tRNA (guanosine(46)-N7)-methyltransferase TrmB [Gammaproteobacteria bacterium]|nr:tRNA (guanosine(46)-N7)-methyltransferase TrmB [Gammaproteobacteria bacterium]